DHRHRSSSCNDNRETCPRTRRAKTPSVPARQTASSSPASPLAWLWLHKHFKMPTSRRADQLPKERVKIGILSPEFYRHWCRSRRLSARPLPPYRLTSERHQISILSPEFFRLP